MAESRERRGLGRGLASLLGEPSVDPAVSRIGDGLLQIPVDQIAPNPSQPRGRIDEEALATLAGSITENGLMQPVVVRRVVSGFELIAGERRWRAARRAGLSEIPALVRAADDRERLQLALVENVVREDLNPVEIAAACACLIEDFGQTHEAIGALIGRSRPAITNLLRIMELPDDVRELVGDGRLTEGHARAILLADGAAARRRLAQQVVAQGLSVRATEAAARRTGPAPDRPATAVDPAADRALTAFADAFDVPVRVRERRGGGLLVELQFADPAALARGLERLADRG